MKIEVEIIPHKANTFTWQKVFNHLGIVNPGTDVSYQLMDSSYRQVILGSCLINQLNLYFVVSSDDFKNDFHIYFFYDKTLSYDAQDAYDFLSEYDLTSHIKDLKVRATHWNKLGYLISVDAQINCSKQTTQWYFGYILALAKAFDGLIVIDEDADKIGRSDTYGENFNNVRFGIYTPEEFEAMVMPQNNQLT